MISGDQLRDARVLAGWTQNDLAHGLGVTLRSIGNWEATKVPENKEALVVALLGEHLGSRTVNPLEHASDMELVAELTRRLAGRRQPSGGFSDPGGVFPMVERRPIVGMHR